MLKKNILLDVGITNATDDSILEYLYANVKKNHKKFFIVTPNPEILVYAHKHPEYKTILNKAEIALPDGVGVFIAGGVLGQPFKQRIPGVDFIEELCKKSQEKTLSMGFLGGGPGVARSTAECLLKKYPWIKVRWVGEEWENDKNDTERSSQKTMTFAPYISEKDPIDILFVAFGFPKQEKWIYENLEHLPVRAAMGVGGSFDYLSGKVIRAPYVIRAMGFEWLFRLIRQPWRLKRQFALIEFIWLLLHAKLFRKPQ